MTVTVKIAMGAANLCKPPHGSSSGNLYEQTCIDEVKDCKQLIQSSFSLQVEENSYLSSNGFIRGAAIAYSGHHHLQIRPDDIWFAILGQLNIYINKQAEEMRGKFISPAHTEEEELKVVILSSRSGFNEASMAVKTTRLLRGSLANPELHTWILPAFTTTSKRDEIVASILIMGSLKKRFAHKFRYLCGIPSVTLLGRQGDWEEISKRLDKLPTFGEEPTQWYYLLKPVLSRFVSTFKTPQAPEISDFWARMINRYRRSGIDKISGWLSAFCFWNEDGQLLYQPAPAPAELAAGCSDPISTEDPITSHDDLCLDGQTYGTVDMENVPRGYVTLPIKREDLRNQFDAVMLAGFIGIQCSSSDERTAEGELGLDTVQAKSGWMMFDI